jgi:4-aminobutyrate aminotransferase
MPLGAMIARDEISTWPDSTHGSTYGGNPVACAAALATIELLEEGLIKNAAQVGPVLKDKLTALKTGHKAIGDVRGLGLMIGVDFEDARHKPDGKLRDRVMQKSYEKGLLLLSCGESTLRFCPPLIVTQEQIATAVEIFESAVVEAA